MPRASKEKNREYQARWYRANRETQMARVREVKHRLKAWFKEYKATLVCRRCGENHPACLDFHHPDPLSKKDGCVSRLVTYGRSRERILAEIEKCVVLCANCHRKYHWGVAQEKSRNLINSRSMVQVHPSQPVD